MPVSPTGIWSNLERSLNTYIESTLGQTYTIRYQGEPGIQEPLPVRWVEVDHADLGQIQATQRRRYGTNGAGAEATWLLTLMHFEQRDARFDGSGNATLYTLTEMMDASRVVFSVRSVIPLRDYQQGGNPQVSAFTIREIPAEAPVTVAEDLRLDARGLAVRLVYEADFD